MSKLSIQSASDIITNSSSEAFICTSYNGESILCDIIDSILKSVGVENVTAKDMFEITAFDDCYEIKPLSPEYAELAERLSGVNDLFYADGEYDG